LCKHSYVHKEPAASGDDADADGAECGATGKRKGKTVGNVVDEKGKVRRKAAAGKKRCPVCAKDLPLECFPVGSGQCGTDKKIVQNLKYSAKVQGKSEWLDDPHNPKRATLLD
jgi:hypothetical protein